MQEEPQHSTSMWKSRPEGKKQDPWEEPQLWGTSRGSPWRGAGGTPSTGGGTVEGDCRAPWLSSPTPLSAAILVSNDGGREARELPAWVQRAFMQEQRDSPVGCDAQPAPWPSPASKAGTPYPHCSVIHREGYLPPCSTMSEMWAPWQDVPTGTTLALIPMNSHELAVSQDGSSKPSHSCGTSHQDCPHWHCSPTSDVSTPWGATAVCQHR